MSLHDLPTLADGPAIWRDRGFQKGQTRLEVRTAARPLTKVTEKAFRAEVWKRDKHRCRCCGRKVIKTMGRFPERGEVHHVHGRLGDLRYEVRAALLLCLEHHERVTGRVNTKRLTIVASKTFVTRQGTFTDAREPVTFQEAA